MVFAVLLPLSLPPEPWTLQGADRGVVPEESLLSPGNGPNVVLLVLEEDDGGRRKASKDIHIPVSTTWECVHLPASGIKAVSLLRWEIPWDYAGHLSGITRVFSCREGGRKGCQSDVMGEGFDGPLQALMVQEGATSQRMRRAPWKLETAREESLPQSPKEGPALPPP